MKRRPEPQISKTPVYAWELTITNVYSQYILNPADKTIGKTEGSVFKSKVLSHDRLQCQVVECSCTLPIWWVYKRSTDTVKYVSRIFTGDKEVFSSIKNQDVLYKLLTDVDNIVD